MTFSRVEWLKKNHGEALSAALRQRERFTSDNGEWLVDRIRSFDPSRNGRFTPWAFKTYLNDGHVLSQLPVEDRNQDRCHAAVSNNGVAIDHVPQEYKTVELRALACKTHGIAIGRIPVELRSREICLDAVGSNGYALQHVPEHLLDEEMYEAAVKSTARVFELVPKEYRTEAVCLAAMAAHATSGHLIPVSIYMKDGFLAEAVKRNPHLLGQVSDFAITYDVMVSAVSQDTCYLSYVPTELRESVLAHPDVQARIAYETVPFWSRGRDVFDELNAIVRADVNPAVPKLCA